MGAHVVPAQLRALPAWLGTPKQETLVQEVMLRLLARQAHPFASSWAVHPSQKSSNAQILLTTPSTRSLRVHVAALAQQPATTMMPPI